MSTELVKNGEKQPYRSDVYREFILWTAMPHAEKVKLGLENQNQFSEYYRIGPNTATRWKERPDFENRVDAILKMWSNDKTPDVVHAIYRTAIKGNPMSQMLWLQYFKGFNPKKEEEKSTKVEIGVNDIRHLIEQLPEPLKSKHYGNLRELLDDATSVANARDAEDSSWTARPAEPVQPDADKDAQVISGEGADGVARSYSFSLCSNLEWQASQNNHQSAARWWEK